MHHGDLVTNTIAAHGDDYASTGIMKALALMNSELQMSVDGDNQFQSSDQHVHFPVLLREILSKCNRLSNLIEKIEVP